MNTSKEERSLKKDLDRLNQWPGTNKKKFTRVKNKFLLLERKKKYKYRMTKNFWRY